MWVVVAGEEALKIVAARSETKPRDRFSLVALFGIWELMLGKSVWGLTVSDALFDWNRVELLGLAVGAGVAVLMHIVTAAIDAFHFEGRLWAAYLVSWTIHTSYNEMVDLFGPSVMASGALALILAPALVALWPRSGGTGSASSC